MAQSSYTERMATATAQLTLHQFREQYANESGYEYWFGEVVRKAVPTWLHALLQQLLGDVLIQAGYRSGPELTLRIDPEWEPRPDVAASLVIEQPYPTKPIDIVAEVLSPEDRMSRVFEMPTLCAGRYRADLSFRSGASLRLGMEPREREFRTHRRNAPPQREYDFCSSD